jgi:hypothetical protein
MREHTCAVIDCEEVVAFVATSDADEALAAADALGLMVFDEDGRLLGRRWQELLWQAHGGSLHELKCPHHTLTFQEKLAAHEHVDRVLREVVGS